MSSTRDTFFSSWRSSSWALATAATPQTPSSEPSRIAARRALWRARRNLPLLGSIVERALALYQTQRIVGEDQNEQRSDHRESDLLEPDVRLSGDGLTTERLQQCEQDVSAVEHRDGEQMEGNDGDVDHRQELEIRIDAPAGLLAGRLGDEQRTTEILPVVERPGEGEPQAPIDVGDQGAGGAEPELDGFEKRVAFDIDAMTRSFDADARVAAAPT